METERFKSFTYDELVARDNVEDLTAAPAEFEAAAAALEAASPGERTD